MVSSSICCASQSLYAVDIDAGQSLETGLQAVIDRLTPGPNDHENPEIKSANARELLASSTNNNHGGLHLQFKPRAVQQLMARAGQQPWIKNRPKLLTWVCQSNQSKLQCLEEQDDPMLFASIKSAAKAKGLELDFSAVESDLKKPIDYSEFKKTFIEFFKNLAYSKEQEPEAVLFIRLGDYPPGKYWHQDWSYESWSVYYHDHINPANGEKINPTNAGFFTMQGLSKYLFEQGEKFKKESHAVDVRIGNIQTAKTFHQVEDYLSHIPGVSKITLNSVTADAVLYTLDVTIPTALLKNRLDKKYASLPNRKDEDIINYRIKT